VDIPSALTPVTVGRAQLNNRVAFAATVNNLGHNREITPAQVAFYEARARGGAGLIITEGLSVHPTSIPNGTVPLAYEPDMVPGFTKLAEAVHRHGQRIVGQLWHVGRQALWNPALQPWSPSGERDPYSGSTPHAMSEVEIAEVVRGFVESADNLRQAGFDGVELHGAHGYLITQFLSASSNRRGDAYGGDIEGRCRMLLEIIAGIRERCGSDFIIGLKLSAHEYVPGGLDLEETQRIVALLAERQRPDYLGVSQANFSPSLEYHVPDLTFPDVPFAHLAAGVREAADGIPTMALAKVPDLETASRLVDEGVADLVGMSRAWLADPSVVRRAAAGEQPRPCVYCNVCWDFIHTGRAVACIYAPETGRESVIEPVTPLPAEHRLPVRVVGAGAAGLEAARVAALRGHAVEVYEKGSRAGGWLAWEGGIPARERMGMGAQWLAQAAAEAGARIRLSEGVDAATVREWAAAGPVILATGAVPVVEPVPGAEVLSLEEAWDRRDGLTGPVAIVDEAENEPVYAVATALAAAGLEVHLVTRREAIGRRVAFVSRIGVLRRLDEQGVGVHAQVVPRRVEDGQLIGAHVFSGRERPLCPAATVVRAGPYASTVEAGTLPDGVLVIGDASAPRDYVAVTQEAHRVASDLGALQPAGVTA
jgi:2,4-dienoyl-CoA reductase-like NADH-dependent reductase (Old Yellow Enzyme family)